MRMSQVFILLIAAILGACEQTEDSSITDEVTALQIEGVWVFEQDSDGSMDSVTIGRADIVDGCLLIGDMVVVWHISRRNDAERVVSEVLSGNHPPIKLGGGSLSLNEGTISDVPDFPVAVTEHCDVSEVWFAADTPAEFLSYTDDSGD